MPSLIRGDKMATYDFQLILSGVSAMTEDMADELYEAGCDDATPFSSGGIAAVGFSREALSFEDAIRTAISDVQRAGFTVARAESADESLFTRINQELARG
jgi:hypothetical protein